MKPRVFFSFLFYFHVYRNFTHRSTLTKSLIHRINSWSQEFFSLLPIYFWISNLRNYNSLTPSFVFKIWPIHCVYICFLCIWGMLKSSWLNQGNYLEPWNIHVMSLTYPEVHHTWHIVSQVSSIKIQTKREKNVILFLVGLITFLQSLLCLGVFIHTHTHNSFHRGHRFYIDTKLKYHRVTIWSLVEWPESLSAEMSVHM